MPAKPGEDERRVLYALSSMTYDGHIMNSVLASLGLLSMISFKISVNIVHNYH